MAPKVAFVLASTALLAAAAGAVAQPSTIDPLNLLSACSVVGPGECSFLCKGSQPIFILGAGLPGAAYTIVCGDFSATCLAEAFACGLDLTGKVLEDAPGTCRASGPAVATTCFGGFQPAG